MKTVLELFNEDILKDNFSNYEKYIGIKVKVIEHREKESVWSDRVHTITKYEENICGDGCCDGFYVSDITDVSFSSSQLLVINS